MRILLTLVVWLALATPLAAQVVSQGAPGSQPWLSRGIDRTTTATIAAAVDTTIDTTYGATLTLHVDTANFDGTFQLQERIDGSIYTGQYFLDVTETDRVKLQPLSQIVLTGGAARKVYVLTLHPGSVSVKITTTVYTSGTVNLVAKVSALAYPALNALIGRDTANGIAGLTVHGRSPANTPATPTVSASGGYSAFTDGWIAHIASVLALPLPTGAATEATLATRLADATFTGRINTQGQKTMAASTPVVIASDQSAVPVSAASLPLPTGAATLAEQQTQTTALQLIDNIVSGTGANVSQFGGSNVVTGTGTSGAGIPRMTVSSDSSVATPLTHAQATGTLTSTTCPGTGCVSLTTSSGYSTVLVSISGTYSIILALEWGDGTSFFGSSCMRMGTPSAGNVSYEGDAITLVNVTFAWSCIVSNTASFRARASTYTSGTANIIITASNAPISSPTVQLASENNLSTPRTIGAVAQGTVASSAAGYWWQGITDGSQGPATVKAASTAAVAADKPLVVAPHPSSIGPVNLAQVGGTTTVNGGVAGILAVGGNVANAVAATANPVPVGGIFTTTPATLTTGQTATAQYTAAQNLKTDLSTVAGTATVNGGAAGSIAMGGTTANDTAITQNPVLAAAEVIAQGTQPTAATAGRQRRILASTEGVQFTQEGNSNRFSCFVQGIIATTQCQAAPGAGLRAYVTSVSISNQTATVETVDLVYGTGAACATGITALTHKWQFGTAAVTTSPFVVSVSFPTPLVPAAANAICVRLSGITAVGATITGFIAP